MRTHVLAAWRLVKFVAALVYYAAPLWVRAARGPIDWQHHQAVRQRFCRKALQLLRVDLEVAGEPYRSGPCVYASNHRSWLDPFCDLAVFWAFPVAKAEVGELPFVAAGAKATGILYVDRGSADSRRAVVDAMVDALRAGRSILIYPEGTTSTEPATKSFKRGGFTVAVEAGVPVVPVAIRYPSPAYHWGEGQSLWTSFVRVAGARRTRVRLAIGPPLSPEASSESLCAQSRAWIDAVVLGEPG